MPTITVDGVGKFNVDDSFTKMSPQDQHDAVDEMVASVRGGDTTAATPPAASHSLGGAAVNSLVNGLPEAVHSGEAAAANYLKGSTVGNLLDSLPGYSMAQSAAAASAASNKNAADSARAYSRPASVPSSISDAVTGANGVVDGAARLGMALAYGTAENAAPVGANLAMAALPGTDAVGLPMLLARAGLGVTDGLQSLGGVRDAKMKAGLSGDTTSTSDIGNAALQLALMRAAPGGNTVGGIAGRALRTAEGSGLSAIKGAAAPVMDDVGADIQGGQTSAGQILSDGLDGAAAGAGLHAAGTVGNASKAGVGAAIGLMKDTNHLSKLGGADTLNELVQNQQAGKQYADAVGQADDALRQQYPGASDSDIATMADQAAQKGGATKPADLSANAQRLQDDLNTLALYSTRQAASSGSAGQSPSQVMKGLQGDMRADLTATAAQWKRAGTITPDDHSTLTAAINEALAHNKALGTGDDSHSDTPFQRIGDIDGLSDDQKDKFQSLLRVADTVSQNGLLKNQVGPLGSLGHGIGATVGHAVMSPLHGIPIVGGPLAATIGHSIGGVGKKIGAGMDAAMGNGVPQILARAGAIQGAADKAGIVPSVTAADMQGLRDDATAGVQSIASAKVAAAQQRAQAAAKAAGVTSAVTGAFGQGDSGWMASVAKDNGITGDSIRRFLAASVTNGKLTQDAVDHLSGTDNIGQAIAPLATIIRNQVQSGQWDQQHQQPPGNGSALPMVPPSPPAMPPAAPQQTPPGMPPAAAAGPAKPPLAPMGQQEPQGVPAVPQRVPVIPPAAPVRPQGPNFGQQRPPQQPPVVPPAPAASGAVLNVPPPVMPPATPSRPVNTGLPPVNVIPNTGSSPAPARPSGPAAIPADALVALRGGSGSLNSVRNPITYQAVVARDAAMQQQIAGANPALAPVVNAMAHGRTPEARRKIMEDGLAATFGHELGRKAAARAMLAPFANFGRGRS